MKPALRVGRDQFHDPPFRLSEVVVVDLLELVSSSLLLRTVLLDMGYYFFTSSEGRSNSIFLSVHSFCGTLRERYSALHGHEPIGETRIVTYTHPSDANELMCPVAGVQLRGLRHIECRIFLQVRSDVLHASESS